MPTAHRVVSGNDSDDGYHAYLKRIQDRFNHLVGTSEPLFATTAKEDLFAVYLYSLPESERQYCNCHACRNFIERFGGLALLNEHGDTASPIWIVEDAPDFYKEAAKQLALAVQGARVTGVFRSKDSTWGQAVTGPWVHFHLNAPAHLLHSSAVQSAEQWMAEKREEHGIVSRALSEWTPDHLDVALRLLETDALYRSEKVIGPVRWLRDLQKACKNYNGIRRMNIIWRAVATAPAGFCHPRASMAGTLLDDIASGLYSADDIAMRFKAKMHPLQYQRPQAAPTAGNIAAGEKVIAALGAERSLLRRFARFDEVQLLWRPRARQSGPSGPGVFGHLKAKGAGADKLENDMAQTITWEKFARTVLPGAEAIELLVRPSDNFGALLTAVDFDAPPILAWDRVDARNPFSWYVWASMSSARQWGLDPGSWATVSGISLNPSMWAEGHGHQGKGVVLILRDARESRTAGNCLFPEILRPELRAVRSTIEAYSRGAKLEGMAEGDACGLILGSANAKWNAIVRVTGGGLRSAYHIDRWD